MTDKRKFHAVRGVRDILPPDTSLWNWFEATARDVLETFNFREIRLPIFEEMELFARSVGAETDIVSKEMYGVEQSDIRDLKTLKDAIAHFQLSEVKEALIRFFRLGERFEGHAMSGAVSLTSSNADIYQELHRRLNTLVDLLNRDNIGAAHGEAEEVQNLIRRFDVGGESAPVGPESGIQEIARSFEPSDRLTLRPEATASVVRAYIEHGMQMLPGLVKLYYAGPMFRRERPQKGRYRQFYQIGAEVLGTTDHPAIDAELIEMLTVLLDRCKLENWTLLVNSIGDANCRPAYVALLREELRKVKDQLGPDSQRRIETNPLRVLDSKLPEEQAIIAKLPMISDHLCDACRDHFAELRRQLDLRSIPYKVEPRLVRGLDYYMRTTFEITSPHLGAQNALAGGGRYDGLSEMLGGPPAKGIGFALGQDRFIEVIQTAGRIDATRPLDAFIVWMGAAAYPAAVRLARRLRQEGLCVEVPAEEPKLRKALSLAERLGARFAVIIGEDEVKTGEFTVKRLADGEQRKLAESDVAGFVKTSAPPAQKTESKSKRA